jgi:hypothetical protein
MRALILISVAAALASCTRPLPPGTSLAQETAGRVAGPAQSCVSTFGQENLRVLDAQTVAYGWGNLVYINHLAGPCPALSPQNTVIVEGMTGSQYCRGDRVRGLEPGSIIPGPSCNLGDWVPYRRP